MNRPRFRAAALCLTLLSACSGLSPVALAKLSQLDPITVDPAQIAVRLDLPDGLAVPPGGATLVLRSARSDTGQSTEARLNLAETGGIWALTPQDAVRLRDVQSRIRQWEAEAPEAHSGSFSIGVAGCASGDGPDPAAPIRADLSLDGGASFLPILRGVTVQDALDAARSSGPVPLCDN